MLQTGYVIGLCDMTKENGEIQIHTHLDESQLQLIMILKLVVLYRFQVDFFYLLLSRSSLQHLVPSLHFLFGGPIPVPLRTSLKRCKAVSF